MSSLSFLGNATSYLRIPNTNDFDFGTDDFTIEWYQYQRDSNPYPRIFQVGTVPLNVNDPNDPNRVSMGVSIEGGSFYYWRNISPSESWTRVTTLTNYKNRWIHFAISRSSGVTKIFMNGNSIGSINDTYNYNGVYDLVVGNESTPTTQSAFGGYITYFSWVKGTALYTSNFTVSNNYPSITNDYVLLLKASSFDGTLGNTVINNLVSTVANVPPNFGSNNNNNSDNNNDPPSNEPNLRNMKSLYSNNSAVFYKPGSLPSCGVGSVRNSSAKSRKI